MCYFQQCVYVSFAFIKLCKYITALCQPCVTIVFFRYRLTTSFYTLGFYALKFIPSLNTHICDESQGTHWQESLDRKQVWTKISGTKRPEKTTQLIKHPKPRLPYNAAGVNTKDGKSHDMIILILKSMLWYSLQYLKRKRSNEEFDFFLFYLKLNYSI